MLLSRHVSRSDPSDRTVHESQLILMAKRSFSSVYGAVVRYALWYCRSPEVKSGQADARTPSPLMESVRGGQSGRCSEHRFPTGLKRSTETLLLFCIITKPSHKHESDPLSRAHRSPWWCVCATDVLSRSPLRYPARCLSHPAEGVASIFFPVPLWSDSRMEKLY